MLILILFIIVSILSVILLIFLKEYLKVINNKFNVLRHFINSNYGIFTLSFMFIFFIEQLFLIYISYAYLDVSPKATFFISMFALIVLTTATLEKFILEKKFQYQKQEIDIISYENQEILTDIKTIVKKYELLSKKYYLLKKKR